MSESLEQRVERLEDELSFIVRYWRRHQVGHATPREIGRAMEIEQRLLPADVVAPVGHKVGGLPPARS